MADGLSLVHAATTALLPVHISLTSTKTVNREKHLCFRKKILSEEGLKIDSVAGALERMAADGVTDLLVQPTHLLDGEENQIMTAAVRAAAGSFEKVSIGAPLLYTEEDLERLADILIREYPLENDQIFAWMGHGSAEIYPSQRDFRREGRGQNVRGHRGIRSRLCTDPERYP